MGRNPEVLPLITGAAMSYCCVPGCTSYQRKECDKELSFHRFPSDQKVCREWIVKIRRDVGPYFQVSEIPLLI